MRRDLRYAAWVNAMSFPPSLRTVLLLALGSALAAPACSSSTDATAASNPLTADVRMQAGVTDTALQQIVSVEADDWGWAGGVFDAPASDPTATSAASVPGSRPYHFAWHADRTDPPSAAAGAAGAGDLGNAAGFTGMAYLLVFRTPSNAKLLRVFTMTPHYTPDADAWKALRAVDGPITVTLTTATFEGDALTVEGGPHKGQTLVLTIGG